VANESDEQLHVSAPKTTSVGIRGVRHAMKYAFEEMGVTRSASTLRKINQVGGFDCPGCAWPDPAPGERSHFEFCENGARAAAWEATRSRVDRAFFATHTIAHPRRNRWSCDSSEQVLGLSARRQPLVVGVDDKSWIAQEADQRHSQLIGQVRRQ